MQRSGMQHFLLVGTVLAFYALGVGACGPPDEEAEPRLLPDEPGKLSPGAYHTDEFEPAFSFELGEGWAHEGSEASDALLITRGRGLGGGLGFAKVREVYVYKPTKTAGTVVEAPEDLVGWFRGHPYLETTRPERVTVGGVEGRQLDVVVGELPGDHHGDECGDECVDLFRAGLAEAYPVSLWKGYRARFIVLEDVRGETVVTGLIGPSSVKFEQLAPEARKVLDTVRWRGG